MFVLCLRAVLVSSPDTWDWTRMHTLVVMHRRTLCENVDSAKIKVPFYKYRYFTRGIDASYRHTLYQFIDPYRWIVTPLLELEGKDGRDVFSRFLKMGKDSAARIELGSSFHQMGTVNEKVCESDFVPLWDGTIKLCLLAERKLLEGT